MLLDRPERRRRAIDAALCVGILAASFACASYVQDGPILCPLRLATGIPCPACGLTRSFCAVAAGHPAEAFAEHLLGPVAFACAAGLAVAWGLEAATGRRVAWLHRLAYSQRAAWALAAVLVAYHAVRLVRWGVSGELAEWIQASWGSRALAWLCGLLGG